ncbi:MAG: hypothetical protein NW208_11295 [Bryobacter sp.]|nr:hypothetical protein [Bryobacter sp.]
MLSKFPGRWAALGLIAGPLAFSLPAPTADMSKLRRDPREIRLERFFAEKDAPAQALAKEFILAADRYGLDWRLLPSIAFVESTGGKAYKNNNMFGWQNGDHRFRSIHSSIYHIAERLANSHYYKGKNLDRVLYTYNPIEGYRERVKAVMQQLGPSRPTKPVRLATTAVGI